MHKIVLFCFVLEGGFFYSLISQIIHSLDLRPLLLEDSKPRQPRTSRDNSEPAATSRDNPAATIKNQLQQAATIKNQP